MENLIYGLRCPKTDEYRYIGKSSSGLRRAKSHLTFSHNESVNVWVMELRDDGLAPLIDVLENCKEDELLEKEKFWIQFYSKNGCRLFNEIVYRGSSIEKLEKEIQDYEKILMSKLGMIKQEINEVSNLHTFIRNRRKNLGVTQEHLSELVGTTLRTINTIELGKGNPSHSTIKKILDILGYDLVPILKKTG
jgi:DNA-binding XRE family transcriptional regulator